MNEIDRLVLLARENATMKMRMEITNVIDLELEKLRAQIKEMQKNNLSLHPQIKEMEKDNEPES